MLPCTAASAKPHVQLSSVSRQTSDLDLWHLTMTLGVSQAHAHMCPPDPISRTFCFTWGNSYLVCSMQHYNLHHCTLLIWWTGYLAVFINGHISASSADQLICCTLICCTLECLSLSQSAISVQHFYYTDPALAQTLQVGLNTPCGWFVAVKGVTIQQHVCDTDTMSASTCVLWHQFAGGS